MSQTALIERITRSLAYMLRHQPEKFDLEVDEHGYADLGDVVRALNERLGEPVRGEDVEVAVESGDRPRYEIREGRIRALYGHSIPVEPGSPSKPPETLFVAIPEQDVDRARRFGLRGGRRRFLHLATSEDDARETGRRGARDYSVLSIRALDAWEEGVNFYDRQALWLSEDIPTHLVEVGETYHDGTEPRARNGRPGDSEGPRSRRRRGRGRERRDDRYGREERNDSARESGRGPRREREEPSSQEREERGEERPAAEDRGERELAPAPRAETEDRGDRRPRGGGRRPRREGGDEEPRRGRGRGRERQSAEGRSGPGRSGPGRSREERGGAREDRRPARHERPVEERRAPAPERRERPAPAAPSEPFGAGVVEAAAASGSATATEPPAAAPPPRAEARETARERPERPERPGRPAPEAPAAPEDRSEPTAGGPSGFGAGL